MILPTSRQLRSSQLHRTLWAPCLDWWNPHFAEVESSSEDEKDEDDDDEKEEKEAWICSIMLGGFVDEKK